MINGTAGSGTEDNAGNIAQVLESVSLIPGLENMPEIQKLTELASKPQFQKSADAVVDEVEETDDLVEDVNKKAPNKAAPKKNSLFFGDDKKPAKSTFKAGENFEAYIKKAYGVEKPQAFFDQYAEYKAAAEKTTTLEGQNKDFVSFFETLPEDLYEAIQVAIRN